MMDAQAQDRLKQIAADADQRIGQLTDPNRNSKPWVKGQPKPKPMGSVQGDVTPTPAHMFQQGDYDPIGRRLPPPEYLEINDAVPDGPMESILQYQKRKRKELSPEATPPAPGVKHEGSAMPFQGSAPGMPAEGQYDVYKEETHTSYPYWYSNAGEAERTLSDTPSPAPEGSDWKKWHYKDKDGKEIAGQGYKHTVTPLNVQNKMLSLGKDPSWWVAKTGRGKWTRTFYDEVFKGEGTTQADAENFSIQHPKINNGVEYKPFNYPGGQGAIWLGATSRDYGGFVQVMNAVGMKANDRITNKTLDFVRKQVAYAVRGTIIGKEKKSSAVGAWQMTGETMNYLVDEWGEDPKQKFSLKNQDKWGKELLAGKLGLTKDGGIFDQLVGIEYGTPEFDAVIQSMQKPMSQGWQSWPMDESGYAYPGKDQGGKNLNLSKGQVKLKVAIMGRYINELRAEMAGLYNSLTYEQATAQWSQFYGGEKFPVKKSNWNPETKDVRNRKQADESLQRSH